MSIWRGCISISARCFVILGACLVSATGAQAETPANETLTIGVKEWFSQGNRVWSHDASEADRNLGNPTSKLRYQDTGTNITELTARLQLKNKMFLRGAFGFGTIGGGRLTDDDFLSAQGAASQGASVQGEHRFSRTYSDINGDNTFYFNGDVGVTAHTFQDNRGTFALFTGLQYWRERHTATGLTQIECTTLSAPNPVYSCPRAVGGVTNRNQTVITNTMNLLSSRIGGEFEYKFDRRVTLHLNVAMLLSYLNNEDVHHLRTDLGKDPSFRMVGLGIGTNADADLRVRIWNQLYLTGGYRVWFNHMVTGQWRIYGSNGSEGSAPLTQFQSLRHGPTVGLTYTF